MSNVLPKEVMDLLDDIAGSVLDVRLALKLAANVFAAHQAKDVERNRASARARKARSRDKSVTNGVTQTVTATVTVVDEGSKSPGIPVVSGEKALAVSSSREGFGVGSPLALSLSPSGSDSGLSKASSSGDRELDGRPRLHATVLDLFAQMFLEAKGSGYVATPADRSSLGRLFGDLGKAGMSTADVMAVLPGTFRAYLNDPDEFLERQGWSLKFFCTQGGFNKYRAKATAPPQMSQRAAETMEQLERNKAVARKFAK